jgi:hypothetical protein
MVCREICGKTVPLSLVTHTLIKLERCIDCGCSIGISNILFNDTLRCKECRSMYYLTISTHPHIDRKHKVHTFGIMEHYIDRTFADYVEKMKIRIGDLR